MKAAVPFKLGTSHSPEDSPVASICDRSSLEPPFAHRSLSSAPKSAEAMGKIAGPTAQSTLGKMGAFSADASVKSSYFPMGMSRPGFVSKHVISFR